MMHNITKKVILKLERQCPAGALNDIPRRRTRLIINRMKERLFSLMERPCEGTLLAEVKEFFSDIGQFNIDAHESCAETFEILSCLLQRQIVIVDESCNYHSTTIFPQRVDRTTGARTNAYDVARDTLYLLRVRYPVVDRTHHGSGDKSFFHYHGMVSPNGLVTRQLKRVCLFCVNLYHINWLAHKCPDKTKMTCKKCHRYSIRVDPDAPADTSVLGTAGAAAAATRAWDPIASPLQQLAGRVADFCIVQDGLSLRTKCSRCTAVCRSEDCAVEHLRVSRCNHTAICVKCKKSFVCVGALAPKKTRILDDTGKLLRTDILLPTEHLNCFHCKCALALRVSVSPLPPPPWGCINITTDSVLCVSFFLTFPVSSSSLLFRLLLLLHLTAFCKLCGVWERARDHLCRIKRPGKAVSAPWGLGSIHLEMRRDREGGMAVQLAALAFHSARYGRKKVDYCLLTDLVKEYRHERVNFIHHTSGLEGFDRVPYLEGRGMCESLRYPAGSHKY
jgi:hypothetical protein